LKNSVLLPAKTKLFFVGVGTGAAAAEFATQLEIDPAVCFGDASGAVGDAVQLEKGFATMWNPPAVTQLLERNDQTALQELGVAYKSAADAIGITNLAPNDLQDTLRQGGTFVFRGSKLMLEYYDTKVGDNCPIEDILTVL